EATGGLRGLIEETGCSVVAPQAGLEVVKECCPIGTKIRSAETIDRAGWFQGEAIALEGRGHAAAYNLRWAKKSVVISGQMPIKPSPQAIEDLFQSLAGRSDRIEQHLKSLDRLSQYAPDLWLPAKPFFEQNANVYGSEWASLVETNKELVAKPSFRR